VNNVTSFPADRDVSARVDGEQRKVTRIFLLGQTKVIGPSGDSLLPKARKTKAVFAYLCLSQGEVLARARLADLIWDRSNGAQGLDAARHALSDLNQIDANWRLERERHTVRLDTTSCWVDAFEVPDRADRLLDDLQGVSASFDQWLHGERARFETRWQTALERQLDGLIAQDAPPARRASIARALLSAVPMHEIAVRSLMKAFVDMDERAEAIREFERHRQLVEANELPLSQQTVALYQAIRTAPTIKLAQLSNGPTQKANPTAQAPAPQKANPAAGGTTAGAPARLFEPSIAVLPFRNLSGAKGRDYIVEGLTEDLVEALSRVPGLFVVSRLSAAVFKKQDRPSQEIGAALGVRYLLSGTVRIIDGRVRLVVELAEADTGRGLWRDRFDERISNVLELQSSLAEAVVRAVAPQLRSAELKRVRIKRPEDYTAYDFFLRAQENMHSASRAVFDSAEQLFDSAIAREPYYANALAWRAYWHVMRVGQGWSPDRAVDARQAEAFSQRAIDCDSMEAMAFAVQGHAAAYLHKDFDQAFECFEKALEINPNSARAWLWNASAHGWTCQGAAAVEKITRAMALSPYDPLMCAYSASASLAYLADGQYERAIEFGMRSIRENRSYTAAYKLVIPALVLAGREAEARAPANQLLMLEPGLTVDQFKRRFPGGGQEIGQRCCEALAIAGIPVSE
jgi:TolB-like protein/DNA-binding SARP family transcriptional activator